MSYKYIKGIIGLVVLGYLMVAAKFSYTVANICVVLVALIALGIFINKKRNFNSNFIKTVPKTLVFNSDTLSNKLCIVKNFPGKKIVVMDNPLSKERQMLRAFVVTNANHENIYMCWKDICSYYDEFTDVDALFSFIDKTSGRLNIMFIGQGMRSSGLDGMEEFMPKPVEPKPVVPKIKKTENKPIIDKKIQDGQIVVEFDDLDKKDLKLEEKKNGGDNHIVDIDDLYPKDKIDINFADAQTISTLPGINIIMAKKIVEYRNINGLFKTKQKFLEISGVKEHFKEKILKKIFINRLSDKSNKDNSKQERTVDL